MSDELIRHPASIVDYAAWRKGYMPPTEHVLIDQLSYRGARVILSCDMGDDAYWLVVRNVNLTGRKLLVIKRAIEAAIDALNEDAPLERSAADARGEDGNTTGGNNG